MPEKKAVKASARRQHTVRMDTDVANRAKKRAIDEGRSWSQLVEQAIREYLRRETGER